MNTNFTKHMIRVVICSFMLLGCFGAFAQPIITLKGKSTIEIEVNSKYTTPGATAYDTIDGNLDDSIKFTTDLEIDIVGIYTETFSVTNSRGQTSSTKRMVIVRNDLTLPVLNLMGGDTIYIEASRNNPDFKDPGATANDNKAPFNLTSAIIVSGDVNTRRVGVYRLHYVVQDVAGNTADKERIVIVRDTRSPHWLDRTSPRYLATGKPFIDAVSAEDDYDNAVNIQVTYPVTGAVDMTKAGQYDYIYLATDSSGNTSDTLFISYIVDLTAPVITLNGPDTMYIEAARNNPAFSDPGATATDNLTPFNLTSSLIVSGSVDTKKLGTYMINYMVMDINENQAIRKRTVIVRDTRAPIWINTNSPRELKQGQAFVDLVRAEDAFDYAVKINVSYPATGPVDENKIGQYEYIYTAKDSSGNEVDTLRMTYVVKEKLSIADNQLGNLSLYPCPAKDVLHIVLPWVSSSTVSIKMYTADGRLVSAEIVQEDASHFIIQVDGLSRGIYFLDINAGEKVYTERIVRE